jgi:hypothetical protein
MLHPLEGRTRLPDRQMSCISAAQPLKKWEAAGIRYTVLIRGKESFLFHEGDKWFVEQGGLLRDSYP